MTDQLVLFTWDRARPDNREFRQNSSEFLPLAFSVGIYIPRTSDYIYNVEDILKAELGEGNIPEPIYTPKAIQYCLDKLGEYLHDPEEVKPEDFQAESWDIPASAPHDTVSTDDNEDWGGATKPEESWDTLEENTDDKNLPWDEEKENWS